MNLVIKLFVTICSIFIFISNVGTAEITPHHCCENGIMASARKCQDGSNISLACDEGMLILDPSRSSYQLFSIGKDEESDGKAYLDAYMSGYHVYQPYFCTGDIQYFYSNRTSYNIAIACSSSRIWYKDAPVDGSETMQTLRIYKILNVLNTLFNYASIILLLMTAAIYYALPNVRDVQGTCYFFFTLISGLGHGTLAYMEIFNIQGIFPNMCITNTYLLVYFLLCFMSWSTVTSYHIWRSTMNFHCDNEAKLLKRYKIFGFGLPFAFVFCAWAYVHISHMADETLSVECSAHQTLVYGFYVALPVMISVFSNFLMFVHSQIRIWNFHSIQLQDRKLTKKILKFRLFMNAKLFFIMGAPWAILTSTFVFENSLVIFNETIITVIQCLMALLIYGEGISIFLVLVIFRKRVLRGIGNKWFANSRIYPDKWKTTKDSETEEEASESETPPRSLEAKFTAQNDEQNDNILDDTAIVIL